MAGKKFRVMQLNDFGDLVDDSTGEITPMESAELTEKDQATLEQEAWDTEMERLRWYNKFNGTLHLVQALGQLFLSFTNDNAKLYLVSITSLFNNWDTGYPVQTL